MIDPLAGQLSIDNNQIKFSKIGFACQSDSYSAGERYGIALVYSAGTYPCMEKIGRNIRPAYLLMKKSSFLTSAQCPTSNEGQVHGRLIKWFFKEEPSVLKNQYNFVFSGGGIKEDAAGVWSKSLNSGGDAYHDNDGYMADAEKELWKGILALIKAGKFTPGNKVDVSECFAYRNK